MKSEVLGVSLTFHKYGFDFYPVGSVDRELGCVGRFSFLTIL